MLISVDSRSAASGSTRKGTLGGGADPSRRYDAPASRSDPAALPNVVRCAYATAHDPVSPTLQQSWTVPGAIVSDTKASRRFNWAEGYDGGTVPLLVRRR